MFPYIHLGPLTVGSYGLCAAVAFVLSWVVVKRDFKRRGLPVEIVSSLVLTTSLIGLAGAKVYYLCEAPYELQRGIGRAIFSSLGLSWLGGLIAGTLVLIVFARIYKIPLLLILDIAAPIGALAYGIGRIGCQLAGDGDYGTPTSLPWGMTYPHGVVPVFTPVHPTPIYEAIFCAVLFYFLWRIGSSKLPAGTAAGFYLVLGGVGRFLVEFIKLNPRIYFGLTNPQVVSFGCVIVGIVLLAWLTIKNKHSV